MLLTANPDVQPPSTSSSSSSPPLGACSLHRSLSQILGSIRGCTSTLSKALQTLDGLPTPPPQQPSTSSKHGAGWAQLKPILKACRMAEESMTGACSRLSTSLQPTATTSGMGGAGGGSGGGGGGNGGGKRSGKAAGGGGHQRSPGGSSGGPLDVSNGNGGPGGGGGGGGSVDEMVQEAVDSTLALGARLKAVSEYQGRGGQVAAPASAASPTAAAPVSGSDPSAQISQQQQQQQQPRSLTYPWQVGNL